MLKPTEHIEYINNSLQLIVSKEHTFGTDALLLASFACPKRNETAVDLGAGCGIIPFYWLRSGCKGKIYGVDVQPLAFEQMQRSAELNNGIENFIPILSDLRDLKGKLPFGVFDVAVMNPPYKAVGTGILSDSSADKIARHGTMCSFNDLCGSAHKLLKYGGKMSVCLRPERLCEMICAMKDNKIEPKRMRFVSQRPGLAPWLVLIEGRNSGNAGLTVLPELYIESDEMEQIIGEYRKG